MYAKDFNVDVVQDRERIAAMMHNSEFDENRAPQVLAYNEYMHPLNEKAANQVFGCKTSAGKLPTVEGE